MITISHSDSLDELLVQLVALSDKYIRFGKFIYMPFLADFDLKQMVTKNQPKLDTIKKKYQGLVDQHNANYILLQPYRDRLYKKLCDDSESEDESSSSDTKTEDLESTDSNGEIEQMLKKNKEREEKVGLLESTLLKERMEEKKKQQKREAELQQIKKTK